MTTRHKRERQLVGAKCNPRASERERERERARPRRARERKTVGQTKRRGLTQRPAIQALWLAASAATTAAAGTLYMLWRSWRGPGPAEARPAPQYSAGQSAQLCRAVRRCKSGSEAVQLLHDNLEAADENAYRAAIEACGRSKDWRQIWPLLHAIEARGLHLTEPCFTAAISAFGRSERCSDALQVLRRMADYGVEPGISSYTAAVSCCTAAAAALELFDEAKRLEVSPLPEIFFVSVIAACGKSQECERALSLLDEMQEHGVAPGARAYNAALAACCKAKQLHLGWRLLEEMRARAVPPNEESFSVLISAARKAGLWDEAGALAVQAKGRDAADARDAQAPPSPHDGHLFTTDSLQALRKAGTSGGGGKVSG
jgi:pentatricopeptide repeat protein